MARANTAAVFILILVVGLSVAAILQAIRAERNAHEAQSARGTAERELARAREAEAHALAAQAGAQRRTGEAGQRSKSVAALAEAAGLQPSSALRDEALAALALPDLSFVPVWTNSASDLFLQFSPSQRFLAISSARHELKLLTTQERQEAFKLPFIGAPVERVVFSPDERFLSARYENGSNIVWELDTSAPKQCWGSQHRFAGFNADSDDAFVVDNTGQLRCVRLRDGQELWHCQTGPKISLLAAQPKGLYFALFVSTGPAVQVRDVRNGELVRELEGRSPLGTLCWSEDGRRLVIGRDNGCLEIWDTISWTQTSSWRAHDDTVVEVRFDPLGRWLASASWDRTIRFWSLPDFRPVMTASGYAGHMVAGFSPDGRHFACSRGGKVFGFLEPTASPVLSWFFVAPGDARGSWSLDVSMDGKLVAASYADGVRLLDAVTGEQIHFQLIRDCRSALFTADGSGLVTSGAAGLAFWPVSRAKVSGSNVVTLATPEILYRGELVYASMTADTRWVAAAERGSGCIQLCELQNPTNHFALCPHELIQFVAFSPNGKWVVSGTWGGRGVKIWELATRQFVAEIPVDDSACATFSPDSRLLVIGSHGYFVLETGSWKELYRSPEIDLLVPPSAFSPDGQLLAMLKSSHIVELRVPATGQVLASLEVPGASLISLLRFTPDSTALLALEWTRQLLRWNLPQARRELAKLRLDWTMPAAPNAEQVQGPNGDAEVPRAGAVAQAASHLNATPFPPQSGAWFYTFALIALVLGVFVGLYTLRYHQRMMRNYEEVESLAAERHKALAAAQTELLHGQKMRALGTLAAGIAHDFNNLLSVIRMGNNFLGRPEISTEEKTESRLAVEHAVDQGKSLVRSMLGYSRQPGEAAEAYSVTDLVNASGLLLNQQFLSGITFTLELASDLPPVLGRRDRLQQILLNLMVNATEAMNGQGRLRITARLTSSPGSEFVLRPAAAPRYIELVIEDTGPGIDPNIRDRIFEPFFSTKPRGASSGTGLGLSLVHSMAEQEKLGLTLETATDRGTKFTIWIPIAEVLAEPALASLEMVPMCGGSTLPATASMGTMQTDFKI
jgi:signal transduction histidine kinase